MFRIYAHVYHNHLHHIEIQNAGTNLNQSFKHFMLFVEEFELIEEKGLTPLNKMIKDIKEESMNQPR